MQASHLKYSSPWKAIQGYAEKFEIPNEFIYGMVRIIEDESDNPKRHAARRAEASASPKEPEEGKVVQLTPRRHEPDKTPLSLSAEDGHIACVEELIGGKEPYS